MRSRVAAAIVLLYAQPLSRIVRLTLDDVIKDADAVWLRLGDPPSPVPGPVAELLLAWAEQRTNMNTATIRESRWLFPGRRAGQPIHPETLGALVKALGVPALPTASARCTSMSLNCPRPSLPAPSSITTRQLPALLPTLRRTGPATHRAPGPETVRLGTTNSRQLITRPCQSRPPRWRPRRLRLRADRRVEGTGHRLGQDPVLRRRGHPLGSPQLLSSRHR